MPSHIVHLKAADIFGIQTTNAAYINHLVDGGVLHDLGRRLPHVSKYSLIAEENVLTEKQRRRKLISMEIEEILKSVSKEGLSDAFYLHHAVDLLGQRYISATLLQESLDNRSSNVISAILTEIKSIYSRIQSFCPAGPILTKDFIEKLQERFPKVWNTKEIFEWVVNDPIPKRIRYDNIDNVLSALSEYIKKISRISHRWMDATMKGQVRYISSIPDSRIKIEFQRQSRRVCDDEMARDYAIKKALREACRLTCLRSRILDCFLLTPYPIDWIADILLTIRKGRASLCKITMDHIQNLQEHQAMEAVERTLKDFEKIWLLRYNIKLPEGCTTKYFETLKTSWRLIEAEL